MGSEMCIRDRELPSLPRFEAEAGEEIYGAILFDKRIEENLQKDRFKSGTALNVPVEIVPAEIKSPKRKVKPHHPKRLRLSVNLSINSRSSTSVVSQLLKPIRLFCKPFLLSGRSTQRFVGTRLR